MALTTMSCALAACFVWCCEVEGPAASLAPSLAAESEVEVVGRLDAESTAAVGEELHASLQIASGEVVTEVQASSAAVPPGRPSGAPNRVVLAPPGLFALFGASIGVAGTRWVGSSEAGVLAQLRDGVNTSALLSSAVEVEGHSMARTLGIADDYNLDRMGQISAVFVVHPRSPLRDVSTLDLRQLLVRGEMALYGHAAKLVSSSDPRVTARLGALVAHGDRPVRTQSVRDVVRLVSRDPNAIGLVALEDVDDRVRMLRVDGLIATHTGYPFAEAVWLVTPRSAQPDLRAELSALRPARLTP